MLRFLARILYVAAIAGALTLAYVSAADAQTAEQRSAINKYADQYGLDPRLLIAIAGVESGYNNNAVGALGEQGLFQLRPEFHKNADLRSLDGNVRTAARYLAHLRAVCGPTRGVAYFTCFNTGPNKRLKGDPKRSSYYQRVAALYYEELAKTQEQQQQQAKVAGAR